MLINMQLCRLVFSFSFSYFLYIIFPCTYFPTYVGLHVGTWIFLFHVILAPFVCYQPVAMPHWRWMEPHCVSHLDLASSSPFFHICGSTDASYRLDPLFKLSTRPSRNPSFHHFLLLYLVNHILWIQYVVRLVL